VVVAGTAAGALVALVGAGFAGWTVHRPAAAPAARRVVVEVTGTSHQTPLTGSDDCGDPYGLCPGPPTPVPVAAQLVVSTAAGQSRFDEQLPWQQTLTVPAGGPVQVSAATDRADELTCRITVDGAEVAKQQLDKAGTVTCVANL
jgi:hypothetical protein